MPCIVLLTTKKCFNTNYFKASVSLDKKEVFGLGLDMGCGVFVLCVDLP